MLIWTRQWSDLFAGLCSCWRSGGSALVISGFGTLLTGGNDVSSQCGGGGGGGWFGGSAGVCEGGGGGSSFTGSLEMASGVDGSVANAPNVTGRFDFYIPPVGASGTHGLVMFQVNDPSSVCQQPPVGMVSDSMSCVRHASRDCVDSRCFRLSKWVWGLQCVSLAA